MRRSILVFLTLLLAGPALAQGIGSVAAKEKQKRDATGQKEKPKVITNDDLKSEQGKSGTATPAPEASSTAPASESGNPDAHKYAQAPAEPNPLDQAQAAVDSARGAVIAAEEKVKALGDKLNPMSPSFIYGQAQSGDAAGEEIRTREALRQAEAELAQARDALVKANEAHERVRQGQPARAREDR
jgi:hypothetical protein